MSLYKPIDADVIIVGGGVAGLCAAFYLFMKEPSLNVLVLEGTERIGGRAFSLPLAVGNGSYVSYFDLGRQWVCKEQNQLLDLLDTLGISLTSTPLKGHIITEYHQHFLTGRKSDIFQFLNPVEKYQFIKFIAKIESLCRRIKEDEDERCIKELSKITLESLINETISSRAVESVINFIVFFNCGVRPSQMSALFYVFFCISTNGISNQLPTEKVNLYNLRIKGGAQNICHKIAEVIGREYILTGNFVTEITCNFNNVLVTTDEYTYCCYRVIMAVAPKDILNIKFTPPLPREKIRAIENTSTSHVTNFVVTYPSEFWKDSELSGDVYVCDKSYFGGPIDFCCNITKSRTPALAGKILGGKVTSKLGPSYKEEVLYKLSEYFGDEALSPTDYYEKTWHLNSGEMVCWKVGNDNYINDIRSTDKLVYWAGAETSTEWYGQIAGAVSSGSRVALEVLYDLRPALLTTDDMMSLTPSRRSRRASLKECEDPYHSAVVHWKYYAAIGIVAVFILWRLKKRYND